MIGSESETLKIVIKARDEASKVFSSFSKKHNETMKNMKKLGVMGSAAIGAVGVASVKMAADFEKSMSSVSTLIDTNTESMEDMEKAVLDISKRTPVALEDLSSALYDVRSAGIDASDAMEVLENSAKLATTGLGTTKEATDVLTSAINAFGLDAGNSGKIADTFFKTVKSGKTTVAELAQGFGQVAPLANELGVQFEDLMSITAAMTTSGMKASVAYTQQRAILSSMLKPTKEMQEAMNAVDITSENLSETIGEEGLWNTIMMLSDAVDGDQAALAKMFGSVEGLNAVMMILNGTGMEAKTIMDDMTQGTNAMDEAMIKQNATASAQYQILKNQLNAELIKMGNIILPILIESIPVMKQMWDDCILTFDLATEALSDLIVKAIQAYDWLKKVRAEASIGGIGARIGGGIQAGMGAVGLPTMNDFISRPGSAPVSFSPQDTIIGVKKPAALGGGGIVVNINGGNYLSEDAAEEMGDSIISKLKTQLKL